jgi:hypothetical protein
VDEPAKNCLEHDESVDCDSDTVVRVCQASLRSDCKPSENEDDSSQEHSCDLHPNMQPKRQPSVAVVEPGDKYGSRDNEKKCQGGEDAVDENELVVLREAGEAVGHS